MRCKYAAFGKICIACKHSPNVATLRARVANGGSGRVHRDARRRLFPVGHIETNDAKQVQARVTPGKPAYQVRVDCCIGRRPGARGLCDLVAVSIAAAFVFVVAGYAQTGRRAAACWLGQRELTPAEKKIIANAIAPSLRDAATAQYRWPKIQSVPDGPVNYCGMVNAKSPYAPYNGRQAFIVSATVSNGKISSAVVGLVAGGKDFEIVRKMCKKYDLDPDAS